MNFRHCLHTFACCLLLLAGAWAQGSGVANDTLPPALWRPCDHNILVKRTFTGPVLASTATGQAAQVRVESTPQNGTCFDTTILATSASTADEPYLVERLRPLPTLFQGNGMNLVDWSPDGRVLLVEVWQWNTMPNDALLWKRVELVRSDKRPPTEFFGIETDKIWGDQKGRNCHLEFKLLGFTATGQVAMLTDVTPYYEPGQDPSEVPPSKTCVEKHEAWAVDARTQKREPLPSGFQPQRYSVTKDGANLTR